MKRVHLCIRGRVQGVWYRASTEQQARELGLRGWVRNRRDGSVEAVAEGEDEAVEALVRWCHQGPPLARVSEVERHDEEPAGLGEGFDVRPTA
jgi:acylphosphatase